MVKPLGDRAAPRTTLGELTALPQTASLWEGLAARPSPKTPLPLSALRAYSATLRALLNPLHDKNPASVRRCSGLQPRRQNTASNFAENRDDLVVLTLLDLSAAALHNVDHTTLETCYGVACIVLSSFSSYLQRQLLCNMFDVETPVQPFCHWSFVKNVSVNWRTDFGWLWLSNRCVAYFCEGHFSLLLRVNYLKPNSLNCYTLLLLTLWCSGAQDSAPECPNVWN